MLGYLAVHNRSAARHARAGLAGLQRSVATTERSSKAMHQAVPGGSSVVEYHAPFDVRVVCTITGSGRGADGGRLPLNLEGAPRPGDLYVKTCRGFALTSTQ